MKKYVCLLALACYANNLHAQLLTPADGGSSKASVSERVGITDVTVSYGRPAVKGRDGKIWGGVVHNGFQNLGYGNGKPSPWRAGANENTVIEFSTEVNVEGHTIPAGKYGFFVAYAPSSCTLIFSSNTSSWGSFFYDEKEDVLRVNVKPVPLTQSTERLTYSFGNETDSSATITLSWEKLAIPFTVSTQLQQQQLASFDRELRGEKGFDPHALEEVADYLQEHNLHLNEALDYASRAVKYMPVFSSYMTRSKVLDKMNRTSQADSARQEAMSVGTARDLHNYARSLLKEKKTEKAFEVFQYNYKRFPNTFTTNMGLAYGNAAMGKQRDALKYANLALPQAPDEMNKKNVETVITNIKEGKEL